MSEEKYLKVIFTFEDVVAICKWHLEQHKPDNPRIKVFVGFEVKPAVYAECTHCETPEEALKMALRYDKRARELEESRRRR